MNTLDLLQRHKEYLQQKHDEAKKIFDNSTSVEENNDAYSEMLYYTNAIEVVNSLLELEEAELAIDIKVTDVNTGKYIYLNPSILK